MNALIFLHYKARNPKYVQKLLYDHLFTSDLKHQNHFSTNEIFNRNLHRSNIQPSIPSIHKKPHTEHVATNQ